MAQHWWPQSASQVPHECRPRILLPQAPGDPTAGLRATYGVSRVQVDAAGSAALMGLASVEECVKFGRWRAVIDQSVVVLTAGNQGLQPDATRPVPHTRDSLQVWLCRLLALVRLGFTQQALEEAATFGPLDAANLRGESGESLVPFALRLFVAELPSRVEKCVESLDQLYALLAACDEALREHADKSESAPCAWRAAWGPRRRRVLMAIANSYFLQRDYGLAADVFARLTAEAPTDLVVLSAAARQWLDVGDTAKAAALYAQVRACAGPAPAPDVAATLSCNDAFVAVAKGDYAAAATLFLAAFRQDGRRLAAANNHAVCLLYAGNLTQAREFLETLVLDGASVDATLVLNLSTVFELESNKSTAKRQNLIVHTLSLGGEDFNVSALKM